VHRIGRTGRAGTNGLAISLVSHEESGLLRDIQRLLKQDLEIAQVEGFEISHPLRMDAGAPKPRQGQRQQRPGNKSSRQRRPHTGERKPAANTQTGKRRNRGRNRNAQHTR
jgi:ATP-dependent RNA helicase RhlE